MVNVEKAALADKVSKDHTSNTIYVAFKIKKTDKEFLDKSNIIMDNYLDIL